ncbi:MAG TPA: hypothetical protein VH298_10835 [Jatrophihabitans sp.]|nr:hypothetical protein [Jatrophihabitans sp.]
MTVERPALLRRARHRPPIRPARMAAVALAVLVLLIAAVVLIAPLAEGRIEHHAAAPAVRYDPNAADALSWATVDTSHTVTRALYPAQRLESLLIDLPGDEQISRLTDFAPGRFSIDDIGEPEPVTVDGHPGYFGQIRTQQAPDDSAADSGPDFYAPQPALAWQLVPDRWVVLDGGFGAVHTSEQQLLAIVPKLGIRPRTEPVRVPVTLGYLPPGWSIEDVTFGDAGQLGPQYPSVSIDLRQGGNTITFTMSKLKPGTVEPNIHRQAGDYWLSCFAGFGDVDPTLAGKILDSAKLAAHPDGDNASWFPVATLLR